MIEGTVLRDALDMLRVVYEWAINNGGQLPPPFQRTSMAIEPNAADWAERVNKVAPEGVPDAPDRARRAPLAGNAVGVRG